MLTSEVRSTSCKKQFFCLIVLAYSVCNKNRKVPQILQPFDTSTIDYILIKSFIINMLKILKYEFWPYKCVAMGHSRHFKFGIQINNSKYYPMDEKLSPREGAWSHDHFLKFWDPLHKYVTGKARNFKFGIRIDLGKSHLTVKKYPHMDRSHGQGPIF